MLSKVLNSPSLEVFKIRLDEALSNLVKWKVPAHGRDVGMDL